MISETSFAATSKSRDARSPIAATAESAISAYADLDLDLAVIDLMLPGMDGWALSERL